MLREKYNSLTNKRGYLYIRETIYKRDGRTLKRKPSKLCDGSATKNRYKYSIKKDTYCGKIQDNIKLDHIITFEDYISKNKTDFDFIKYKLKLEFDTILDDFVEYILFIYEIDKNNFFNGKKKVYEINNGYFSKETIEWVRRFRINKSANNPKEFERFSNRCYDTGIYDDEIINSLYLKLIPDSAQNILLIKEKYEENEIKKIKTDKLRNFIQTSIEKD